jgi:PelA/Pel-15E family pectate lyase
MINALKILRDVAKKKADFLFVDEERRKRAAEALEKAVSLILKLQVTPLGGKKTVWAAQYDAETLAPASARSFEPAALTGAESVGIVRFLMLDDEPPQATVAAVEAAVEWYRSNKIEGFRWERKRTEQGLKYSLVKDAKAPPLWGRFYQIETMKPIFVGRDGVIKYDVSEIEAERGGGYSWFTDEPNELLNKDYPKWRQKIGRKTGNN